MKDCFSRPVCGSEDWERFDVVDYFAREHGPGGVFHDNAYVSLRRKVLFDIWFPREEHVEIRPQFCRLCGFVCYAPRPEAADIQAKYEYLQKTEVHVGGQNNASAAGLLGDQRRAWRVHETLARFAGVQGRRVLDVGGGDGKLGSSLFPVAE